ncbi:MAG: tol-pal system protein YbgF [Alphaproteobacteria bacterium]|nr:tol-pal system protein YbgF [Alphaproteobacteria bacterium]
MKKTNFITFLTTGTAVLFAVSFEAFAQSANAAMDEIAILREDLKILQRQVYRSNNEINPTSAADFAVKIGEFDEEIRKLTGRIDQLEFKIQGVEDKIDLMNKDIDVRIKMIEGKPINAGKAEAAEAGTVSISKAAQSGKFSPKVATNAPKSVTGDSVAKGDDLAPVKTKSAADLYQAGLDALKTSDYAIADQNFNSILKRYPDDKLAGNAQYWLGEVYYAKKDWQRAAIAFAKGIEKYKDGAKGADSLLKLGMSMKELGKKDEACQSFSSVKTEFPKAETTVLNRAAEEAKKLGCK